VEISNGEHGRGRALALRRRTGSRDGPAVGDLHRHDELGEIYPTASVHGDGGAAVCGRCCCLGRWEGASLVTGGERTTGELARGSLYKPIVFTDVDDHMTIAREEIFGPMQSVLPYDDVAGLAARANTASGSRSPRRTWRAPGS
jgi:hypothetical protein